MLTTTHWLPNRSAARVMSPGSRTAAVFTLTLSAPARSAASTSSTLPIPPPTVRGTKRTSAVRRTVSRRVRRPSTEADTSRKTISSAPSAS